VAVVQALGDTRVSRVSRCIIVSSLSLRAAPAAAAAALLLRQNLPFLFVKIVNGIGIWGVVSVVICILVFAIVVLELFGGSHSHSRSHSSCI